MSQPAPIIKAESGGIKDSYIVVLKAGAAQNDHIGWLDSIRNSGLDANEEAPEIIKYSDVFNGYSTKLTEDVLLEVAARDEVQGIYQNAEVRIDTIDIDAGPAVEQDDGIRYYLNPRPDHTTWGLARIRSNDPLPQDANPTIPAYSFSDNDSSNDPSKELKDDDVDVYVLDTGIKTDHQEFNVNGNSRAIWGKSFYKNDAKTDNNGHGTHVAGTAAGTRWGVAKNAHLIAVQVLADDGGGESDYIVAGIDWCIKRARRRKVPSVINMSLRVSPSFVLNEAVTNAVREGLCVCVSAGNSNGNAANQSPASAKGAICVGSSTIEDKRSDFSNYGPYVDVFAPGSKITSAGITTRTAYSIKSGTSMVTPHVTGVVARLLRGEPNLTPAAVRARLEEWAQKDKLELIPDYTVNRLLHF